MSVNRSESIHNDCDGYVLYSNSRSMPIGIISENYKRRAAGVHIPRFLRDSLVMIEDKRFYRHWGFDYIGIGRAITANIKNGKIVQGGSTLTQQLAKHLIEDNRKTFKRKLLELIKSFLLEFNNSKDEILTMYLNEIYWGSNLYGVRAASLHYFKKEPFKLTNSEQLTLITLLRGPNYYLKNPDIADKRFQSLNDRLLYSTLSRKKHRNNTNYKFRLNEKRKPLEIYSNVCIPFITKEVNHNNKLIFSTIDISLQEHLDSWVSTSKYPVTAICIEKGRVVAVSSSFGHAHAFIYKANVGSTLKPFIYTFLRENHISRDQTFSSLNSNLPGWNVREANSTKPNLTLDEALYVSNNNAFVNACLKGDLSDLYKFLSQLLEKPISDFTPSAILGATSTGITLYELAKCYYQFFCTNNRSPIVDDCCEIMREIAKNRLMTTIDNIFLKTGTTNDNAERYAVLGNSKRVLAVVRGENPINDLTKEGNFLKSIKPLLYLFLVVLSSV